MQTDHYHNDIRILRDLAKRYADLAALPIQDERRRLWADHFSLKPTRPLVLATYGLWNVWCRELFGPDKMRCTNPFYRVREQWFHMQLFHHTIGDDFILEPWLPCGAVYKHPGGANGEPWGLGMKRTLPGCDGGAYKNEAPLQDWSDLGRMQAPPYEIDEAQTAEQVARLRDAVGDILEVDALRGPQIIGGAGDISSTIGAIRGIEQIMYDMYESPAELKRLLVILRDGIIAHQNAAERAGGYSLTTQTNQAMTYANELERPRANSGPRRRKDLWLACAAQEYTLISPAFHEEFLLEYQKPILAPYGLVHYGCCEDLTEKIDMLRQLPNLRSIAVTPSANVRKCAERIGADYAISWRPSPADTVCTSWDTDRIRNLMRNGLDACRGGHVHIILKDIETVQGEPDRLARWVKITRELSEHQGG